MTSKIWKFKIFRNDEHQSGAFLLKEFNVVIPRDGEWRQSEGDGVELCLAVGDFGGE